MVAESEGLQSPPQPLIQCGPSAACALLVQWPVTPSKEATKKEEEGPGLQTEPSSPNL